MTWPKNQVYQQQLVIAVTNLQTAPSFLLLGRGKNPHSVKWSIKDRLLFTAVHRLEQEKCPHCGVPRWHGSTTNQAVDFDVQWSVCYGCAEKADRLEHVKEKPGEWAHVHAVPAEGFDRLPSREEGYSEIAVPLHSGDEVKQSTSEANEI